MLAAHRLARGGALALVAPDGRLLRAEGGGHAAAVQRRSHGRVRAARGVAEAHRRCVRRRRVDRRLLGGPLARVAARREEEEGVARVGPAREDAVLRRRGRAEALLGDAEAFGRSGCGAGAERELGARDGVAANPIGRGGACRHGGTGVGRNCGSASCQGAVGE